LICTVHFLYRLGVDGLSFDIKGELERDLATMVPHDRGSVLFLSRFLHRGLCYVRNGVRG